MDRTNKLHRSRVDWETIKEDDFNRTVEYLLLKIHEPNAYVLDGRGGDGGIDVAVKEKGKVVTIYQLKHFREGFSGEFRKGRGKQIKDSFDTAWVNHMPATWILVMPRNPTKGEVQFVEDLGQGKEIEVDIWGQGKLDLALGEYPQIERAVLREEVVDLLNQMGQEKAALEGPQDLGSRLEALSESAEIRSQYWTTDFSVIHGVAYEEYIPKRQDAMEKEPISTTVRFEFGSDHKDVEEKLRRAIDFGAFDEVDLPPATAFFKRKGPSWVKPIDPQIDPSSTLAFVSRAEVPKTLELLTFNVVDDKGISLGRFEGKVQARARGSKGISIKCLFGNIVTGILSLPYDRSTPGNFTYSYDLADMFIVDVAKAVAMSNVLSNGAIVESYFNGQNAGKFQIGDDAPELALDPFDEQLIEDLLYLQQKIPAAHLTFPAEVTPRERVMLRVGRRLLEGNTTVMPPGTAMTGVLSGESSPEFRELVINGGLVVNDPQNFILEIQGSKYSLGPALMFHRSIELADRDEVLAALDAGRAEGMYIVMRTTGAELIQVWLGRKTAPMREAPEFKSWDLIGIDRSAQKGGEYSDNG